MHTVWEEEMPRVPQIRLLVHKDRFGYPINSLAQREAGPATCWRLPSGEGIIPTFPLRATRNSGFSSQGKSAPGVGGGEKGD